MDRKFFSKILKEERFVSFYYVDRSLMITSDNVKSHDLTNKAEKTLAAINTFLGHEPNNDFSNEVLPLGVKIFYQAT